VVDAGSSALIAAVVGIMLPLALEKLATEPFKRAAVRPVMLVLALIALAVHGAMDGAALVEHHHGHEGEHGHELSLGFGVLLHRIPLGLTLWWMVRSTFGFKVAAAVLGGMMMATTGGYVVGEAWLAGVSLESLGIFQALMGGAIMHVALDTPPVPQRDESVTASDLNTFGLSGAGLGGLVVWGIGHLHPLSLALEGELEAWETFWALTLQASPALLVAFLGAGLIHGFVKQDWMGFRKRASRLADSVKGVAAGIPVPVCSCGVLPFYRGLVQRGVPPAAAIGFLIATPGLGIDTVLLSFPLLGSELTIARLVVAGLVAILAGWLLSRLFETDGAAELAEGSSVETGARASFSDKLRRSLHFGFEDFVDDILPWVLLGIGIGTMAEPVMELAAFGAIPDVLEVPLAALAGIPAYVGASGATPLAAVLLHKGLSPGALIAFLITGPAISLGTLTVLRSMHSPRAAWAMALGLFVFAVGFGWLVNVFMGASGGGEIHAWAEGNTQWWELASVGMIALLLVGSLWRMGPRGFVASMVPGMPNSVLPAHAEQGHHDPDHSHDLGDDHHHDHHHHDHQHHAH
jgi:uncharacterized membrane protein YraQ (UPF0718 family)